MPFLKVNDINMYYELSGKGPPLVLLAGFTCNHLFWHPLASHLAEHFQVLIFDNRGCGRSETPKGPYTVEMFAADVATLMQTLGISNAYALGHSFGGSVLQQLCRDFPSMIRKGIICASLAKAPKKILMQIEAQASLAKSGASLESLILNTLPWLYSNEFLSNRDNIDRAVWKLLHNPFPQSLEGFLLQATAIQALDTTHHLKHIKTPLLILAGDEDPLTPLVCSEYLAEKIPHSKLHIFKNQSHLFIEEKQHEFLGIATSYFKK